MVGNLTMSMTVKRTRMRERRGPGFSEVIFVSVLRIMHSPFHSGANSAAAKAILANAALAVRRRWRRMGRSIENARTSFRNRRTQPVDPRDLLDANPASAAVAKMCVSNSNIELTNEVDNEDEWSVRSESAYSAATSPTSGNASSAGHSPRRHQVWLTTTSLARGRRNPEEDLKV